RSKPWTQFGLGKRFASLQTRAHRIRRYAARMKRVKWSPRDSSRLQRTARCTPWTMRLSNRMRSTWSRCEEQTWFLERVFCGEWSREEGLTIYRPILLSAMTTIGIGQVAGEAGDIRRHGLRAGPIESSRSVAQESDRPFEGISWPLRDLQCRPH